MRLDVGREVLIDHVVLVIVVVVTESRSETDQAIELIQEDKIKCWELPTYDRWSTATKDQ